MAGRIYKIGNLRISGSPEAAEAIRQKLVPKYYFGCGFRRVLAKPYDFACDDAPLFVECRHPEFRKERGVCLGQCALSGQPYGMVKKQHGN